MYIECRHIFPSGKKCESPALTGRDFCYFHNNKRNQKPPSRKTGQPSTVVHQLLQLEDEEAIQLALSDVVLALAANRIDPRRAQILIYGLQVASQHGKRLTRKASGEQVRRAFEDEDGTLVGVRQQRYDSEDITFEEDEDDEDGDDRRTREFAEQWTREIEEKYGPEEEPATPSATASETETIESGGRLPEIKAAVAPRAAAGKRRCRAFLRSTEAPVVPPAPPILPRHFRRYAQKQIVKTLLFREGGSAVPERSVACNDNPGMGCGRL